jgi:hypothetical protein
MSGLPVGRPNTPIGRSVRFRSGGQAALHDAQSSKLSGGACLRLYRNGEDDGLSLPRDADTFATLGEPAAESRIWDGIHYRSDINAGRQLAIAVADKIVERARSDGADPTK